MANLKGGLFGGAIAALGLLVAGPFAAAFSAAGAIGTANTLFNVGFALAGAGLLSGALTIVAGALTKPPEANSNFDRVSPTYGFSQWQNRTKGDAVLPVIYTGNADGHKTAPIYIQAYATPKGEQDDDFSKVLRARGQGISALLAICEGPIDDIGDVRFNDEPVYETITKKLVATGNGTKKKFTFNAKRAELRTFEVFVAGVSKGWKHEARTYNFRHNSSTTVGRAKIQASDEIATDRNISITIDGTALDTEDETTRRPHIWMESPTELRLNMQVPYPNSPRVIYNTTIGITYYVRVLDGLRIEHNGSGKWTLLFDTAPASGAKIEVSFLRKMVNGLNVDWRNGADHQLSIPGFESIRNAIGVSTELTSTEVTKSTENEVDNIVLNLGSSTSGMTEYDDEGNRSPVEAQFTIEIRRNDQLATSIYRTWQKIYDPAGRKGSKRAVEFRARGDSLSQLYFAYSIKGLLQKYYDKNRKSSTAQQMLRDFVRAKYDVRIKRTNTVRNNSSSLVIDNLYWLSMDEVIDEKLSYPGVALLGFSAAASERLQGSAPNVTCRVRGIRSVEKWTGSAWSEDADAQGNPVWAMVDLLTHRRYGAGDHFTKSSNIDTTTAKSAADWLDGTDNAWDGVRGRLDVVLDTRKSPIQWAMDILRPHRVYPVLQGNTWKFVIDQAVTLSSAPVVYEDTTAQRVVRQSVRLLRDSAARIPTELQTRYLDEEEEFEFREVWVAPKTPATDRRVVQAELIGITRRSQAIRATNALYKQLTADGLSLEFAQSPGAIDYEAGDVIRFISSRMGIDGYWRVVRMEFGTADYFVKVQAIPYVANVYGQQDAAQSTTRTGTTYRAPPPPIFVTRQPETTSTVSSTPSSSRRRSTRSSRVRLRIRRAS